MPVLHSKCDGGPAQQEGKAKINVWTAALDESIVSVRSLENIGRENTNSVQHGQGSSTITVTGKYTGIHIEL